MLGTFTGFISAFSTSILVLVLLFVMLGGFLAAKDQSAKNDFEAKIAAANQLAGAILVIGSLLCLTLLKVL